MHRGVTNETIRVVQEAQAAPTVEPDEDQNQTIMQAKRLRNRFTSVKEPATDRHVEVISVQGLPDKCEGINPPTCRDPELIPRRSRSQYAIFTWMPCHRRRATAVVSRDVT